MIKRELDSMSNDDVKHNDSPDVLRSAGNASNSDLIPHPSEDVKPESNGLAFTGEFWEARARVKECRGLMVYRRNKRLKTVGEAKGEVGPCEKVKSDGGVVILKESEGNADGSLSGVCLSKGNLLVRTCSGEGDSLANVKAVNADELEGNLGMVEVEVKEESTLRVENVAPRRFTRSSFKVNEEVEENFEGFEDAVILEAEEEGNEIMLRPSTKKLEMKMSKKIEIKGIPTTVKELFETGLLEGYPVFYNGGKKGIPLRGTIKDIGILCSCALCKGDRVVPPCQFEIHACRTYRRASQYICLENGKSLLDVVKECRKCSLKTLEERVQRFIGPMPVKEAIICRNCKGSFLATSSAKVHYLCDLCMMLVRSEANPTHTSSINDRALEPVESLNSSGCATVDTISPDYVEGRKKRKSSELSTKQQYLNKSAGRMSSKKKKKHKISKRFSGSVSVPNIAGIGSVTPLSKTSKRGRPPKILKRLSQSISPKSSKSGTCISPKSKTQWRITKKDQRMHKLVFEEGGLPDGTEVAYYSRGKKLLVGYKKGLGIFCTCCFIEISPSQFEAHAGWASRKKPYGNIYTSNGVSLHEFAISLLKGRKYSAKDNDDLCIICADGGKLVLCDGCPRAFHKECASLSSIPRGKWYCKYCENRFQKERFVEHNINAVAAGRVSGIDPIEQITKRCIRIVKNPEEAEVIACVICRGYDFSKSGFGPRTVILCDQCEKEYHVGCLKKSKIADMKELPKGKWFCSSDCKRIYTALQNLLSSGAEKLNDSSLDVMRKKSLNMVTDIDVRWRLLSGKITSRETRLLLSEAVAIFHDCFDPIVDAATGRDFIPTMVYGRNIRGQDFGGIYCAILTVNSSVVSAAILRIFGQDIAELPLVATRIGNQGKGYFQMLFSCIEKLLAFLNVRRFVLPAADEAVSIWTEKFGFNKIPPDQLAIYRKTCWQMISFKGTSMLEKDVPKCRIIRREEVQPDIVVE